MSEDRAIVLLTKAFMELNMIRARDGAPAGVSHEYFSELVDAIDECVKARTGKSAHCHPHLYRYALVERSVEHAADHLALLRPRIEALLERGDEYQDQRTTVEWRNKVCSLLRELIQ